ncbi:hypothetical protein ACMY0K_00135 [Bacteroides sp. KG121]|uniref:hypothetical protein n=1 Tax=Bacteroides sp. KG121 TaxID=3397826 RepID=UPI003D978A8B
MNCMNNTLTGSSLKVKELSANTLFPINKAYETLNDTKMRIISTKEEKRNTLE